MPKNNANMIKKLTKVIKNDKNNIMIKETLLWLHYYPDYLLKKLMDH